MCGGTASAVPSSVAQKVLIGLLLSCEKCSATVAIRFASERSVHRSEIGASIAPGVAMVRRIALVVLSIGCSRGPAAAEADVVAADPNGTVAGVWESSTRLGEHEGGVCTVAISDASITLACSPGDRRRTASYQVMSQAAGEVVIRIDAVEDEPTSVQRIRPGRVGEVRVLVIEPVDGGSLLGAYGNPSAWRSVAGASHQ